MRKRERTSSPPDTDQPSRQGWRKIGKAKLGIGLGVVAIGAGVLMPATPALASDSSCGWQGRYEVCININGGGAYVSSMYGQVYNSNGVSEPYIHTELEYPDGSLVKNSATTTIPAGSWGALVSWFPNSNVPTGNYCVIGWQWSRSSGYQTIGYACAPVS